MERILTWQYLLLLLITGGGTALFVVLGEKLKEKHGKASPKLKLGEALFLAALAIVIVVGVVLQTMRQLEFV